MKAKNSFDNLIGCFTKHNSLRFVFFCGAGISFNSGIPLTHNIIDYILSKLSIYTEDKKYFINPDKSLIMPFENFMEAFIEHNSDPTLLKMFSLGRPNTNHIFLSRMLDEKKTKLVLTTNFDNLIEQSFSETSIKKLRVYKSEQDLKKFLNTTQHKMDLVKLHGSVDDVSSIRATITTITNKILSRAREDLIKKIFCEKNKQNTIFILGYSCSDVFDIISTIENIKSSKSYIIFVDHRSYVKSNKDIRIEPISKQVYNNPFTNFQGVRIIINTDIFIQRFWKNFWQDYPGAPAISVNWRQVVDSWVNSFGGKHLQYSIIGHLFYDLSLYDKTIKYCKESLRINGGRDMRGQGAAYSNIGLAYHCKEEYEKSLKYFIKANKIFNSIDYKFGIATSLNNIGCTFIYKTDKRWAMHWLKRALRYTQLNEFKEKQICEGYILNSFGTLYCKFEEYNKSLQFLFKSLDIRQKGNKLEESRALAEIGDVYIKKGNIKKAKKYYIKAASIATKMGNKIDKNKYDNILLSLS